MGRGKGGAAAAHLAKKRAMSRRRRKLDAKQTNRQPRVKKRGKGQLVSPESVLKSTEKAKKKVGINKAPKNSKNKDDKDLSFFLSVGMNTKGASGEKKGKRRRKEEKKARGVGDEIITPDELDTFGFSSSGTMMGLPAAMMLPPELGGKVSVPAGRRTGSTMSGKVMLFGKGGVTVKEAADTWSCPQFMSPDTLESATDGMDANLRKKRGSSSERAPAEEEEEDASDHASRNIAPSAAAAGDRRTGKTNPSSSSAPQFGDVVEAPPSAQKMRELGEKIAKKSKGTAAISAHAAEEAVEIMDENLHWMIQDHKNLSILKRQKALEGGGHSSAVKRRKTSGRKSGNSSERAPAEEEEEDESDHASGNIAPSAAAAGDRRTGKTNPSSSSSAPKFGDVVEAPPPAQRMRELGEKIAKKSKGTADAAESTKASLARKAGHLKIPGGEEAGGSGQVTVRPSVLKSHAVSKLLGKVVSNSADGCEAANDARRAYQGVKLQRTRKEVEQATSHHAASADTNEATRRRRPPPMSGKVSVAMKEAGGSWVGRQGDVMF